MSTVPTVPTPLRDLRSRSAVLVVTPEGGELEEFARRAGETCRVRLARDRAGALRAVGDVRPAVAVVQLHLGAQPNDGLELCLALSAVAPDMRRVLVTPLP